MENPSAEISSVVHLLTQGSPSAQRAALEKYFTPTASFTHPFCRTGSFNGSRWLIWCLYRWYKIMSPRILLEIDSVAYDSRNLIIYVSLHQLFRFGVLPFLSAHANLVTVFNLVPSSASASGRPIKYLIKSQTDMYKPTEISKFFFTFGVVPALLVLVQLVVTGGCVVLAGLGWPVTWAEENMLGGNKERSLGEVITG